MYIIVWVLFALAQPRSIQALEQKLSDAQTAYDAFAAATSGAGEVGKRAPERLGCN